MLYSLSSKEPILFRLFVPIQGVCDEWFEELFESFFESKVMPVGVRHDHIFRVIHVTQLLSDKDRIESESILLILFIYIIYQ